MKKLLYLLLFISCNHSDKTPNTTLFASYNSNPEMVSSGISLMADSSYIYGFASCMSSCWDSGKFTIREDTIFFQSYLEHSVDTNNKWHGQIRPLTGEKYLIKNGRIYHRIVNGLYDMKIFWLHQEFETKPEEFLDSTGNGFAKIYNGRGQVLKCGEFKDFKLFDGEISIYDKDQLERIEIYKNGNKFKDSIISKSWWD